MFVVTNFHPSLSSSSSFQANVRPSLPPSRPSSIFIHVHPNPLFSSIILVVMKKKDSKKVLLPSLALLLWLPPHAVASVIAIAQ
jgi:hypothetical protein